MFVKGVIELNSKFVLLIDFLEVVGDAIDGGTGIVGEVIDLSEGCAPGESLVAINSGFPNQFAHG